MKRILNLMTILLLMMVVLLAFILGKMIELTPTLLLLKYL